MRKFLLMGSVACVLAAVTGCGGSEGGLATESGDMSIEEYEQMAAEEEANMTPPAGFGDAPPPRE